MRSNNYRDIYLHHEITFPIWWNKNWDTSPTPTCIYTHYINKCNYFIEIYCILFLQI